MSRKGKKRAKGKFRQPMRPPGPLVSAGTTGAAGQTTTSRSVSQARVGGDQALVRAVEMSLGGRNQIVKQRGGRFTVEFPPPWRFGPPTRGIPPSNRRCTGGNTT